MDRNWSLFIQRVGYRVMHCLNFTHSRMIPLGAPYGLSDQLLRRPHQSVGELPHVLRAQRLIRWANICQTETSHIDIGTVDICFCLIELWSNSCFFCCRFLRVNAMVLLRWRFWVQPSKLGKRRFLNFKRTFIFTNVDREIKKKQWDLHSWILSWVQYSLLENSIPSRLLDAVLKTSVINASQVFRLSKPEVLCTDIQVNM